MASRYAVTTGDWSAAIWAATVGGAAGSAAVPTTADDVTINASCQVTVDNTSAVANSIAALNGTLTFKSSVDTKLTVQNGITTGSATTGHLLYDTSGSSHKHEIRWNNSGATGSGYGLSVSTDFIFKGSAKTEYTFTSGALTGNTSTSVHVADATGWNVGDILIFATTQDYNATPRIDEVTIATITYDSGSSGAATVTWTTGAGTGGSVLYNHDSYCIVGNFTRNLILGPATAYGVSYVTFGVGSRASDGRVEHVMFDRFNTGSNYPYSVIKGSGNASFKSISSCAFYRWKNGGSSPSCCFWASNSWGAPITRDKNIYIGDITSTTVAFNGSNQSYALGPETNSVVFQATGGVYLTWPEAEISGWNISGCVGSSDAALNPQVSQSTTPIVTDCSIWSCNMGLYGSQGGNSSPPYLYNCRFGLGPTGASYTSCLNADDLKLSGNFGVILKGCTEPAAGIDINSISQNKTKVYILDRNDNTGVQDVFQNTSYTTPAIKRDTGTVTRSTSSLQMEWVGTSGYERFEQFEILTKSGVPITLTGYFRKNSSYGSSTLPYVEISGLGITPVRITATSASTDAWEKFEFLPSTATEVVQSSGADGLLTVKFVGQSAVNGAKCWFSGVPMAPFVTRCRHYGYLFDETSPTRTTNSVVSASEATALAYTGVSVSWGATQSNTTLSASRTLQELYDYTQATACQNVAYAVPITGAGVAGSPALFAEGDISVATGKYLSGSGSLSVGSFNLSGYFSTGQAYDFTGGTFSQASTTPSFDGGTLDIPGTGTYTFESSDSIINFTPTGTGSYNLSSGTFSGTIDLRNTTAHAITVNVPSGATFITTNNTGGTITVAAPTVDASATVLADTRVRLFNVTTDTELDTDFVPGTSYSFTLSSGVSSGDQLRLYACKKGYYNTYSDAVYNGSDVVFIISQSVNEAYSAWGIDGDTVTEFTGDVSGHIQVDIDDADGETTKTRFAAWMSAFQASSTDATGIQYYYNALDYISAAQIMVNAGVVDLTFDNVNLTTHLTFTDNEVRLWRSDGMSIIDVDTHNVINIDYNGNPGIVETGTSGLTPTESDTLSTLASQADELHAWNGLDAARPMTVTTTSRTAGGISATISGDGTTTTTVTRT